MKALFLAGGMGSRLKGMTRQLPKPMIPVLGKPLMARNIERLKQFGIDEIVLSTCYLPDKIRAYFGDGRQCGMKISYVHEESPLGTGGAIRNAAACFQDTFLVFNGDIVSGINLQKMLAFHRAKKAAVTIAGTYVEDPSAYGVLEYDEAGYIQAFKEKPKPGETTSHFINAGIYLFEPTVLQEIPTGRAVSIEKETYPLLLQKHYAMALYEEEAYWRDLGTPKDYLEFQEDLLDGKFALPHCSVRPNSYGICHKAKVSAQAVLVQPVYLGTGVEVGPHCLVGPYAIVEHDAKIAPGATIDHAIVWPGAAIGRRAQITDAIVLADSVIPAGRYRHAILSGHEHEVKAG